MKLKNKRNSTILLVCLVLLMFQSLVSASHVVYFTDVNTRDWCYEPITRGAKNGIIYGYTDRTFKPNNNISVQEFLALYGRSLVLIQNKREVTEIVKPENFGVSKSAWGYREIQHALSRIDNSSLRKFNFENISRPITREEVAFLVNNSLYFEASKQINEELKDIGGTQFEADIKNLKDNQIILGYPDSNFKPKSYITRAETSKIIDSLY